MESKREFETDNTWMKRRRPNGEQKEWDRLVNRVKTYVLRTPGGPVVHKGTEEVAGGTLLLFNTGSGASRATNVIKEAIEEEYHIHCSVRSGVDFSDLDVPYYLDVMLYNQELAVSPASELVIILCILVVLGVMASIILRYLF